VRRGNAVKGTILAVGVLLVARAAFADVSSGDLLYAAPDGSGQDCTKADPCSLAGARGRLRLLAQDMTEDLVVYLRGGTYTLDAPLLLDPADSGRNGHRIRYEAHPDEVPVLSGGSQITGGPRSFSTATLTGVFLGDGFHEVRLRFVGDTNLDYLIYSLYPSGLKLPTLPGWVLVLLAAFLLGTGSSILRRSLRASAG
jgi:hypothetical protein